MNSSVKNADVNLKNYVAERKLIFPARPVAAIGLPGCFQFSLPGTAAQGRVAPPAPAATAPPAVKAAKKS